MLSYSILIDPTSSYCWVMAMRSGLQKDGRRVTVDSRRKVFIQSDKYTSASRAYVSVLDCPLHK